MSERDISNLETLPCAYTDFTLMQNPVYSMVSEALARVVSERAADNMLRAALREASLVPEHVTAPEMQRVLVGPLQRRLSALMPPARARQELSALSMELQARYPKAPTLFEEDLPARPVAVAVTAAATATTSTSWDTTALEFGLPAPSAPVPAAPTEPAALDAFGGNFEIELEDFDVDEFEFDDPDEGGARVTIPPRFYDLASAAGQDSLLSDLARFDGVQGVVLCDEQGRVVRSRISRGAEALGTVMAATARALGQRPWRILCADLGTQTVYVRPLGRHVVALLTASNTNVGRLIGELSVVKESA